MEKYNVPFERLYNADQTGLFFNKMPNRIYLDKDNADFRGVKQMKSKDRVTLMVCTSAAGEKAPLLMVGTAKLPLCFKFLCPNGKPPMPYTDQVNAWFTKEVTIYWINTVLWPWHKHNFGDVFCILLLDNCKAHTDLDKSRLPQKLVILFSPPNCTSFMQPADMGMIASLKVGYRVLMLKKLLAICDDEELYRDAIEAGKKARKGCNGLAYCGKARLLDAVQMLNQIWLIDGKYASNDSIKRCWRRSGLLPVSLIADMNNEIGSASVPEKMKKISDESCSELCILLNALTTKCAAMGKVIPAMNESVAYETGVQQNDLPRIIEAWIEAEDDPVVVASDVEDMLCELEAGPSFEMENDDDSEEDVNVEAEATDVSWTDCLQSFETIR
jgi:hypothetical protein